MDLSGVHIVGLDPHTGRKVMLTLGLVLGVTLVRTLVGLVTRVSETPRRSHFAERVRFWSRQATSLVLLLVLVLGLAGVWFDNPGQLATVAGLATAGVAVALQRVITAFAAYLIILRGRVYTVGDRVTMGGVRGDVVDVGFMQTTIMEMGEPPAVQSDAPAAWVAARQYTGRLVRVTNDRIFDSPVYNYTREYPFLWEELRIPVRYQDDRERVEQILLDAARRHVSDVARDATAALGQLKRRYLLPDPNTKLDPAVYYRLTDNWLELTLRFAVSQRGVRPIKDAMSRDVLRDLDEAGIAIASATYDIVGLPPVRVEGGPAGRGDAPRPAGAAPPR